MAMVARALEKRETERDTSPLAKMTEGPLSPSSASIETIGVPLPDPAKDPKWEGISGDMAKEFGEASPPRAPHTSTVGVVTAPPSVTPIKVPDSSQAPPEPTPVLPSIEVALSKTNIATNGGSNDETFKSQIVALQSLLKQEHDERKTAAAIAKELTVENRCLRDEIVKASAAAAGAQAALGAREELLQHLKEEVAELRAIVYKRN